MFKIKILYMCAIVKIWYIVYGHPSHFGNPDEWVYNGVYIIIHLLITILEQRVYNPIIIQWVYKSQYWYNMILKVDLIMYSIINYLIGNNYISTIWLFNIAMDNHHF